MIKIPRQLIQSLKYIYCWFEVGGATICWCTLGGLRIFVGTGCVVGRRGIGLISPLVFACYPMVNAVARSYYLTTELYVYTQLVCEAFSVTAYLVLRLVLYWSPVK